MNIDKDNDKKEKAREEIRMDTTVKRPCTPAQSLAKSLREMNTIRDGKDKGRTWKELRADLKKEK